ncbi:Hypothetical protein FKW44_019971 [Caligus rogercresseyi]|uniref:Uncharacterized protein n=1 Tax=Caligus rogercresseyi TaxID=217165 RepID=A0A7T8JZ61_CALRO|nr:Hypothetical protein FKW44_019971 [Caligus rogercresseyi]
MIYFVGCGFTATEAKKNAEEKKELFLKELQTRFDVSAESALDIIEADKTLSRVNIPLIIVISYD